MEKETNEFPEESIQKETKPNNKRKVVFWSLLASGVGVIIIVALLLIFLLPKEEKYEIELSSNVSVEDEILTGDGSYKKGDSVTIVAEEITGYRFTGWSFNGNIISTDKEYTFIIGEDTEGEYTANYDKLYSISVEDVNDAVLIIDNKTEAVENEKIVLVINTNSGCEISEVYYIKNGSGERHNINNVDGQYSFIMPNSDITIYVVFSKINYQLATEINNGEILGLSPTAQSGDSVMFTVKTDGLVEDKYYGIERVYYTMEDGKEYDITSDNNVYTFTMPSGNITIHVDIFEKKAYLDYVFDDDSIVSYVGDETEITIPSSYSKVEVPFSQVNSQTFSNYQEFTNSSLYKLWIYQSGYFYLVEDEENILITDFYEFENKMSIDGGPFTIKYENYQFTAEEMDNALQVAMLVNISKGYSFKLVTNDNEIKQIDNITIDNLEEKFNETKELLIQKSSFPVQVQFNDIANISVEGNDYLIIDIGLNAFYGNANLQKVNFASNSNVQTIGERAFGSCYNLVNINLPSSILYIDNIAFDQSNKIEYYYDDNNDKYT